MSRQTFERRRRVIIDTKSSALKTVADDDVDDSVVMIFRIQYVQMKTDHNLRIASGDDSRALWQTQIHRIPHTHTPTHMQSSKNIWNN